MTTVFGPLGPTFVNETGTQQVTHGGVFVNETVSTAVEGTLAGTLTQVTGSLSGDHGVTGTLAGTLTLITGSLVGEHVAPGGAVAVTGGGGGGFMGDPRKREDQSGRRKREDREELRRLLMVAMGLLREADPPQAVVEDITERATGTPLAALPARIDWAPVLRDLEEARSLLAAMEAAAREEEDDDDMLLLAA